MTKPSYLRFGNGSPFDPNPRFCNTMSQWAPWAEHYRNEDDPTGTLANMLGCALEEIDRLCKRCGKIDKAHAALLWAFIDLVETGVQKPLDDSDEPESMPNAWASIQLLNKWRAENKLNIKCVDVL